MSNWAESKLEKLCRVKGGKRLPAGSSFSDSKTEYPYLRVTDMVNGSIDGRNLMYVDPKIEPLIRNYKISKDDLYVTIAGTLGMFGSIPDYLDNSQLTENAAKLCEIDIEAVDKTYLKFYLNSDIIQSQINGEVGVGAGVPKLALFRIEKLRVKYPVKPIQQKIAKILSTIDGQIEKTEAIIAKYQAVKQGMLQDLFTRGIDVTTGQLRPKYEDAPELYKDSPLGMIPKEWECLPLEQVTTYVDYRGKTPPKSDIGVFLVTAKNVKFGYIDYNCSQEYIPAKAYNIVMSRGLPEIGDVLFTTEAPMGNVAQINRSDVALAQRVIKFRGIKNVVTNDFLRISLMAEYFQRMLTMEASGSTVLGIKGSKLHKLRLYVPNLMEQEEIYILIKGIEAKTKTESSILEKYQQIKIGLMSDLLSGKVEVTA